VRLSGVVTWHATPVPTPNDESYTLFLCCVYYTEEYYMPPFRHVACACVVRGLKALLCLLNKLKK
jgi:hypothetical protein